MGLNAAPLERLIEQFAKLPGIGRKSATRLAYQVLGMSKE
ncbi:MAG: recombination protein RecR, partial [Ruthenibacterium sp.]